MPRTFFTADQHFGHRSIISAKFDHPRPFATIEAHDEALIAAWNAVVRPDDIVWHLGDFAYKCGLDHAAGILSRLNGRKHLVRGNHDVGLGDRLDWNAPVVDVTRVRVQDPGMATPRQVWASHYAHRTWPNARRGHLHLYGHSHGGLPPIEGSLDVGVDCWDWRPVTLDRILARLPRPASETRVDLAEMVLLDHVVVHTADVGGPPSLHPDVPGRKGELLVRRRLVETSLELMCRCHLVRRESGPDGIYYRASDEAASYVELLETPYSEHLKVCASWIAREVRARDKDAFKARVRDHIGDWSEEFGVGDGASLA